MKISLISMVVFSLLGLAAAQSSGKQSSRPKSIEPLSPQEEKQSQPFGGKPRSVTGGPIKPNGQGISCPVSSVRTEITTPLPKPWWRTPQEGNLVGTTIETIGGKSTLVCLYSAYGIKVSVMRLPPAGMSCKAADKGFYCQ